MEESRRKRRSPPEGSHDTLATSSVSTGTRAAARDLDPLADGAALAAVVALNAGRAAGEIWMQPAPIATKTTVLTPGPDIERRTSRAPITSQADDGRRSRKDGSMKNVQLTVEGNILTIKVDLSKEFGPSSSGKTIIIGSTEGNVAVPEREEKVGVNVYRKK